MARPAPSRTAQPSGIDGAPEPEILSPRQLEHEEEIRRLERLADWLDTRFGIPGTGIRFGLDSLLGLVPGVGDTASMLPAAYLVWRAHHLGVPRHVLARMGVNVGLDLAIGAIPLVGDLFDLGFKANRRNIALLKRHVGKRPR